MMVEQVTKDATVAPPVLAPPAPVDVLRCWWCDEPVGTTPDGSVVRCVNPKCEAYNKDDIDWDEPPLCRQQTAGGYGRMAISPPEFCEQLATPGTSRCDAHTEDGQWDDPWDDDGPVFLVEGHEHNDY